MGHKLTEQQEHGVELRIEGKSYRAIAEELGVKLRTVTGWTETKKWKDALAKATVEAHKSGIEKLKGGIDSAVTVLLELANDTDQPGTVRASAANSIIRNHIAVMESTEMMTELLALKQRLGEISSNIDKKQSRPAIGKLSPKKHATH